MLDAICSTWFGTSQLYVHMINFLPVTSVTGDLFDKEYVRLEFHEVLSKVEAEMAWKGYVVADKAIFDPNGAWKEAMLLDGRVLDSGTSKTQILYWISTRSGFDVSGFDENSGEKSHFSTISPQAPQRLCASVAACAALDLEGDCCPTSGNTMLGCCPKA